MNLNKRMMRFTLDSHSMELLDQINIIFRYIRSFIILAPLE
jgi:hypothetical protein